MDVYKILVNTTEVTYVIRPFYFTNGTIQDAPSDGKTYARKNGAWVEVIVENEIILDTDYFVFDNGEPVTDNNELISI